MSFKDEFGDWAAFGVSVAQFTGTGAWGDQWGVFTTVPSWFQYENRQVTSSDGTTVLSEAQIFCEVLWRAHMTEGSKVKLPGDNREYRILRTRSWPGDDSHLEVWLV